MKEQRENNLEEGNTAKLMVRLCVQTTCSLLVYQLYSIADAFYVVRGIGSDAAGAVGIFAPVLTLAGGISTTLGAGGGSLLSRSLGEKDILRGRKITGCLLWIWLAASLGMTAAGLLFLDPLLAFLGCTEEMYPYAVEYGRILLAGIVASTGFSGLMRAQGDSGYSTCQWICPVVINAVLDPLLIFGFQMGIAGAAFGTLGAQMFSMVSGIYYFFFRGKTPCGIGFRDIRWDRETGKEILRIGSPAFLASLGNSLWAALANRLLGISGGTGAVSAFSLASRIQSFVQAPHTGMMQGILPMLGFDMGRKRQDRVEQTMRYALRAGLIYGAVCWAVLFGGAERIISFLAKDDPQLLSMGTAAVKRLSPSLTVGGVTLTIQAYYQAMGKSGRMLAVSVGSIFLIQMPLVLAGAILGNYETIWSMAAAAGWLAAAAAAVLYDHDRRKTRRKCDGKSDQIQTK